MTFSPALLIQAQDLLALYRARGLKIATAESCTGGMVAALLTDIAGSSDVVERGFVVYSNAAKQEMLGVPADVLAAHGAVSGPTARALADGALARSHADVAVSITGVAGPGGGTADKPVGLVWFGVARRGRDTATIEMHFGELGRNQVRLAAVNQALAMVRAAAEG